MLFVVLAGCRQDMHDQPKLEPYEASTFFADGRASRPLVEGTVPRGRREVDAHLTHGQGPDGQPAKALPVPLTRELLARGRQRYEIYCSPCHARTGDGDGMIVRRGYRKPPSLHDPRLREAAVGHLYDVIARGFGAMPDYAAQVPVADRWAIVAYIRALQMSRAVSVAELSAAERRLLEGGAK